MSVQRRSQCFPQNPWQAAPLAPPQPQTAPLAPPQQAAPAAPPTAPLGPQPAPLAPQAPAAAPHQYQQPAAPIIGALPLDAVPKAPRRDAQPQVDPQRNPELAPDEPQMVPNTSPCIDPPHI